MRLGGDLSVTDTNGTSDQDRADQEERLKYVFSELLSRIYDEGATVKAIQVTLPSPVEATFRIYYREIEEYDGGVITAA